MNRVMTKNFSVFIIDDEADITLNLKGILKKELSPNSISIAHSYTEAKQLLENDTPDLMFVDINLGDGSGFDVLKILKSKNNIPTKVIMMSAYATEDEISNAKQDGIDIFMQKPFTKENVITHLNTVLSA